MSGYDAGGEEQYAQLGDSIESSPAPLGPQTPQQQKKPNGVLLSPSRLLSPAEQQPRPPSLSLDPDFSRPNRTLTAETPFAKIVADGSSPLTLEDFLQLVFELYTARHLRINENITKENDREERVLSAEREAGEALSQLGGMTEKLKVAINAAVAVVDIELQVKKTQWESLQQIRDNKQENEEENANPLESLEKVKREADDALQQGKEKIAVAKLAAEEAKTAALAELKEEDAKARLETVIATAVIAREVRVAVKEERKEESEARAVFEKMGGEEVADLTDRLLARGINGIRACSVAYMKYGLLILAVLDVYLHSYSDLVFIPGELSQLLNEERDPFLPKMLVEKISGAFWGSFNNLKAEDAIRGFFREFRGFLYNLFIALLYAIRKLPKNLFDDPSITDEASILEDAYAALKAACSKMNEILAVGLEPEKTSEVLKQAPSEQFLDIIFSAKNLVALYAVHHRTESLRKIDFSGGSEVRPSDRKPEGTSNYSQFLILFKAYTAAKRAAAQQARRVAERHKIEDEEKKLQEELREWEQVENDAQSELQQAPSPSVGAALSDDAQPQQPQVVVQSPSPTEAKPDEPEKRPSRWSTYSTKMKAAIVIGTVIGAGLICSGVFALAGVKVLYLTWAAAKLMSVGASTGAAKLGVAAGTTAVGVFAQIPAANAARQLSAAPSLVES